MELHAEPRIVLQECAELRGRDAVPPTFTRGSSCSHLR